jgi:Zn-dependent protease
VTVIIELPMLSLVLSLILMSGTWLALRGGMVAEAGLTVVGLDFDSLGMALLAVLAACWFWGPMYGLALILAVMIHEFGHVAAYRVCGHMDARFRLIPLMGGVAISDRSPDTQAKDFFISLMGPGISVAPMALAFALSGMMPAGLEGAAEFLWVFAVVTASLNFFNLLPLWPLDGGRCLHLLSMRFGSGVATYATIVTSAVLGAIAVWQGSLLLLLFAVMGAAGITRHVSISRMQAPLTGGAWQWAFAAWLSVLAAHLYGSWWFLTQML